MPYEGGFPRAVAPQIVRGQYDFDVDGGTVGTINLANITVPDNAVVMGGWVETITVPTSGGSTTIAVQIEGANDIITATAISSSPWSGTGLGSLIPVFTGATAVKTTQERTLQAVIGTADLTAGKFDVVLFYIQVPD